MVVPATIFEIGEPHYLTYFGSPLIGRRSVALTRRGRVQDPGRTTRNSSNEVGEAIQQQRMGNIQDESELVFDNMYAEHSFPDMEVDSELEPSHSSVEERAQSESSSGSNSREISHAIDFDQTGESSDMNPMWRWPDFTTYPLVFDEQQLCITPSTGNSSSCSNIADAMLSTPPYPHSGFATSTALPLHEIDFSALDNHTTDTAQVFGGHDETFNEVGTPLSLMLDFPHDASRPTNTPEKKGLVTISFKQVDAKVAQDITSSVLKYNDSLVIKLYLE
jgi:hypothetical protein